MKKKWILIIVASALFVNSYGMQEDKKDGDDRPQVQAIVEDSETQPEATSWWRNAMMMIGMGCNTFVSVDGINNIRHMWKVKANMVPVRSVLNWTVNKLTFGLIKLKTHRWDVLTASAIAETPQRGYMLLRIGVALSLLGLDEDDYKWCGNKIFGFGQWATEKLYIPGLPHLFGYLKDCCVVDSTLTFLKFINLGSLSTTALIRIAPSIASLYAVKNAVEIGY